MFINLNGVRVQANQDQCATTCITITHRKQIREVRQDSNPHVIPIILCFALDDSDWTSMRKRDTEINDTLMPATAH